MKKKKLSRKVQKYILDKNYSYQANTPPVTSVKVESPFSEVFDNYFKSPSRRRKSNLKGIFNEFFKNENEALEKIKKWQPEDSASKVLKKIREDTKPLSVVAETERIRRITRVPGGGVRKQRFVRSKTVPLIAPFEKRGSFDLVETIISGKLKGIIKDGKRQPLTGLGLNSYMERNKINHVMDIPKVWPKDKSLKVPDWQALIMYLYIFNFKPEEVLDYALMAVAPTKKNKRKFLELRLFREYENNSKIAIDSFVKIWKENLKSKTPLKTFAVSKPFMDWCQTEDLFFTSDENLRQNVIKISQYWNKENPTDKLPLKFK